MALTEDEEPSEDKKVRYTRIERVRMRTWLSLRMRSLGASCTKFILFFLLQKSYLLAKQLWGLFS